MKQIYFSLFFILAFVIPLQAQSKVDRGKIVYDFLDAKEKPAQVTKKRSAQTVKKTSPKEDPPVQQVYTHLLGINAAFGSGFRDGDMSKNPVNMITGVNFNYSIMFFYNTLPVATLTFDIGFIYGVATPLLGTTRDTIGLGRAVDPDPIPEDDIAPIAGGQIIMPTMGFGLNIYMGSPFYIGAGANVSFNIQNKTPKANIGPYVSLGVFIPIGRSAIDVAIRWNYYMEESDIQNIFGTRENPANKTQTIMLVIGFYGLL